MTTARVAPAAVCGEGGSHAVEGLWSTGQLEALKRIALISMVIDHVGRYALGAPETSWPFVLGRLAFPLFALVLAANLAREGDRPTRAARTAARLGLWAAVSVVPSWLARDVVLPLNVLATLALGALCCWAVSSLSPSPVRLGVGAAAILVSPLVEFGTAGVALVLLGCLTLSSPIRTVPVASACAALGALAALNALFGGWMAGAATCIALPLALQMRVLPIRARRTKWFYYAFYPLHLLAIVLYQAWPG
ncbi:MAG: hypothetical protein RJA99_3330 [Pseudomonadota bacterium]|jgi:hypothetical protein